MGLKRIFIWIDDQEWFWKIIEYGVPVFMLAMAFYYTYYAGWRGLAYVVLAGAMGLMVVYHFGHIIPGISQSLRYWDEKNNAPTTPRVIPGADQHSSNGRTESGQCRVDRAGEEPGRVSS